MAQLFGRHSEFTETFLYIWKSVPQLNIHDICHMFRRHCLWNNDNFASLVDQLVHMTINFTPRVEIACHLKQFYHVKPSQIDPHL